MKAFATIDDLSERWRTLTDKETKRANTLLLEASALISQACEGVVVYDPHNEVQATIFKSVCCSMVQRVLAADVEAPAYTQTSMSAGAYSQSFTLANPNADLYMTNSEKKKLGIKKLRITSIQPKIGE